MQANNRSHEILQNRSLNQCNAYNEPNKLVTKIKGGGQPKILKPPKLRILETENERIYIISSFI